MQKARNIDHNQTANSSAWLVARSSLTNPSPQLVRSRSLQPRDTQQPRIRAHRTRRKTSACGTRRKFTRPWSGSHPSSRACGRPCRHRRRPSWPRAPSSRRSSGRRRRPAPWRTPRPLPSAAPPARPKKSVRQRHRQNGATLERAAQGKKWLSGLQMIGGAPARRTGRRAWSA